MRISHASRCNSCPNQLLFSFFFLSPSNSHGSAVSFVCFALLRVPRCGHARERAIAPPVESGWWVTKSAGASTTTLGCGPNSMVNSKKSWACTRTINQRARPLDIKSDTRRTVIFLLHIPGESRRCEHQHTRQGSERGHCTRSCLASCVRRPFVDLRWCGVLSSRNFSSCPYYCLVASQNPVSESEIMQTPVLSSFRSLFVFGAHTRSVRRNNTRKQHVRARDAPFGAFLLLALAVWSNKCEPCAPNWLCVGKVVGE